MTGEKMSKSGYGIREKKIKDGVKYSFTYYGDLEEAIEKARSDLKKEKENPEIAHWTWIFKKADEKIKAHENRIRRIQAFIERAMEHLGDEERRKEAE